MDEFLSVPGSVPRAAVTIPASVCLLLPSDPRCVPGQILGRGWSGFGAFCPAPLHVCLARPV